MDNLDRAESASSALAHFSKITGSQDEDTQTQMTDLMTNLMHLAHQHKVNYAQVVESAESHFAAEILGEVTWG
jgi:hypothetical protein